MDMQGTPIGSTNQGMKNTSDPERYQNPTEEGAGAVASDSLAAESTRSGGGFSSNKGSEPQSVSGSNSTFANTDTSGADTLAPAPDAAKREDKAAGSETGDQATGTTSSGSGSPDTKSSKDTTTTNASPAPGYVASVVSQPGQSGKPHGKNITEGGFDSDDSKNASFNSEIGSKDDPGRKAENDFQTKTQSASGATGPRQYGKEGHKGEGGGFGVLDDEQSL